MKKLLFLAIGLAVSTTAQSQVYNNGGLSTGATSNSGVAAPAGYTWAEVQNETGNITESNTNSGFAAVVTTTTAFFLADDFTVPAGEKWNITEMEFFIYRTGYTGTTAPYPIIHVNILDGSPQLPSSASVFGDDTTNRFVSGTDSKMYRIFNSTVPPPGSAVGQTRKIWNTKASTPVTLNQGTYWVKYQFEDAGKNAGFAPGVTIPGTRGLPTFNGLQYQGPAAGWMPLVDTGNPDPAPDFAQDMPFIITYTAEALGTTETRQMDNRVRVYPNPTSDYFKLALPAETEKAKTTVSLYDMSGKMVKEFKVADQYDISSLAKGAYMVKVKDGSTIKVTKLIKN
ncbi:MULTISPECIES: T9SS type A sorting domain-containing protein [unclassified Kaistella]|uniref:T9SS type A sorting domain-containing protein n=1 Tax=unclassified Kaistella TaxID=2762626 RepID=UPI002732C434|nr:MULTISPECIES: T9SS type A sorting domain-containing protein [unclassified Kaistella]MDP2455184.1 T9SS type A sorting domain-containing protein [Kaistella sp. SH11-4b]MDP2458158.1 T9SS type A sorting domain-containing protein [Kaistella sp. SH40-3]MDP2460951.1 T9SS type A sorting domain-containing protein [Kaistella sp. SH19-2b]